MQLGRSQAVESASAAQAVESTRAQFAPATRHAPRSSPRKRQQSKRNWSDKAEEIKHQIQVVLDRNQWDIAKLITDWEQARRKAEDDATAEIQRRRLRQGWRLETDEKGAGAVLSAERKRTEECDVIGKTEAESKHKVFRESQGSRREIATLWEAEMGDSS